MKKSLVLPPAQLYTRLGSLTRGVPVLSVPHAIRKYVHKRYDPTELEAGWHGWRAQLRADLVRLPASAELHPYGGDAHLDPSTPRSRHYLAELLEAAGTRPRDWARAMLLSKMTGPASPPDPPAALVPMPFIVGTGRCGTTLLRLMLDVHPALAMPPETHFIPGLVRACQDPSQPLNAFLELVASFHTWQDLGLSEAVSIAVRPPQSKTADQGCERSRASSSHSWHHPHVPAESTGAVLAHEQ